VKVTNKLFTELLYVVGKVNDYFILEEELQDEKLHAVFTLNL